MVWNDIISFKKSRCLFFFKSKCKQEQQQQQQQQSWGFAVVKLKQIVTFITMNS